MARPGTMAGVTLRASAAVTHRARPARRGAVPARRRARTAPSTATGSTGAPGPRWFDPDSPIARVHGDASMFIGGIRALLLQTLHPAAMRAVSEHSGFRGDMWGRLARTSRFLAVTTFGTADDAQQAVDDRPRRSTSGSPAPCPTARRTPPPTRTCWRGCTSPRSTASCAPTRSTARDPLDQAERDQYVAADRRGRRAGSASSTRRPPRPELARGARGVPPRAAGHPARPARPCRYLLFKPPLPLAARAPYGVLVAAAIGADAALDPAAAAAALAAGLRAHRGPRRSAALATGTIRWAMAPGRDERRDPAGTGGANRVTPGGRRGLASPATRATEVISACPRPRPVRPTPSSPPSRSTSRSPARQLARMRERTAAMDAAAAGRLGEPGVPRVDLRAADEAARRRPDVPLFFGRLDYRGRRAVPHRPAPRLRPARASRWSIDWRAPVSLPFYRASRAEPMGVGLRRRYGFQHGRLTAYEDEDLAGRRATEHSAILEAEIERPARGPDARHRRHHPARAGRHRARRPRPGRSACRAPRAPARRPSACTARRTSSTRTASSSPARACWSSGPTPASCATSATCCRRSARSTRRSPRSRSWSARTLRARNPRWAVRGDDAAAVATLKGDARLAEVLRRALWAHVAAPDRGAGRAARRAALAGRGVRGRGGRRGRCARRGVRYGAARAMLPQSLAHRVLVQMELAGDSPDDRVQDAVARSTPVKEYAADALAGGRPRQAGVAAALRRRRSWPRRADGILDADEQALLLWARPPRSLGRARPWSLADAVLLDEAVDLVERTPSLAHIVADEAQDLSPMMLRALGRRSSTGSLTVLGDLAQATTPVGDPVVGRGARPPGQARRARRGADPRASGCPAR